MQHNSETICDDNGIEIIIGYNYESEKPYNAEPGNPSTVVEAMIYTELKSVEVIIAGFGIDILPKLNDKQKTFIINKLQYE